MKSERTRHHMGHRNKSIIKKLKAKTHQKVFTRGEIWVLIIGGTRSRKNMLL